MNRMVLNSRRALSTSLGTFKSNMSLDPDRGRQEDAILLTTQRRKPSLVRGHDQKELGLYEPQKEDLGFSLSLHRAYSHLQAKGHRKLGDVLATEK